MGFFIKNMNKNIIVIGSIITILWLLIIGYVCINYNIGFTDKNLNSLGDFLAGIFAPVAFLWLVLGYVQQGKQLEQNTKALEQQERALQLQIDEMRESTRQQAELAKIQIQKIDASNYSVKPILILEDIKCDYFVSCDENGFMLHVTFLMRNLGGTANNFYIRNSRNQAITYFEQIEAKENKKIEIELTELDVEQDDGQQIITADLIYEFENIYGIDLSLNYQLYYQTELESLEREEKCYLYRVN